MLSEIVDPNAASPRSKLFWAVVAALALVQLAAFYMVCSDQVRQGQARETTYRMQRMALTDCLQYAPDSTIGSCNRQARTAQAGGDGLVTADYRPDAQAAGRSAMTSSLVQANFAFR